MPSRAIGPEEAARRSASVMAPATQMASRPSRAGTSALTSPPAAFFVTRSSPSRAKFRGPRLETTTSAAAVMRRGAGVGRQSRTPWGTIPGVPTLLACPDKFRGTASASDLAKAITKAARAAKWRSDEAPVADGGEGILDVLGGKRRSTRVQGPLGEVVDAEWRLQGDGRSAKAVIEMARAAGLDLVGGAEWNDPLRATTAGVGQLIMAAVAAGARKIIVGVGGSASTDGGQACLEAMEPRARLTGVDLVVACDVTTRFVDAARVFAGQKGATDKQIELLARRLEAPRRALRGDLRRRRPRPAGVGCRRRAGRWTGGDRRGARPRVRARRRDHRPRRRAWRRRTSS